MNGNQSLAWLAALFATFTAASPAASQHRLFPSATEQRVPQIEAYQALVRAVFHEAHASNVIVRMIDQPSFAPEVAIGLKKDGEGYALFVLRPVRQLWSYAWRDMLKSGRAVVIGGEGTAAEISKLERELPQDPLQMPLQRCQIAVTASVAAGIEKAWQTMLADLAPPDPLMGGLDGETYYFGMGPQQAEGTIWSPDEKSRTGRLVQIGNAMYDYCRTRDTKRLDQIVKLSANLASQR